MDTNTIVLLAAIAAFIIALLLILGSRPSGGAYVVENSEEVDGERTLCANNIVAVIRYQLGALCNGETDYQSSPDGRRSYLIVSTIEGRFITQIDWLTNRAYFNYTFHTETESGALNYKLPIRHNVVDEVKLATFVRQVAELEQKYVERRLLDSPQFQAFAKAMLAQKQEKPEESNE